MIRIAAMTFASDSAITITRFYPSKMTTNSLNLLLFFLVFLFEGWGALKWRLIFFSLLFWKRQGKPPKAARLFLGRTPTIPGKQRKMQKTRIFLAKQESKEIKKTRKTRSGKTLILKGLGTFGRKIGAPQNAKSNHDGSNPLGPEFANSTLLKEIQKP